MLRLLLICLVLPLAYNPAFAQRKKGQARLDSLLAELPRAKPDTNRGLNKNGQAGTPDRSKDLTAGPPVGLSSYQPTITVSTRFLKSHSPNRPERATSLTQSSGLGMGIGIMRNGVVEIRVSDNGTGIPDAVKAKIFQPFFTTKPTGEGTGLGLSMSYDIITKGHRGNLIVESEVGQGTTFIIQLPS